MCSSVFQEIPASHMAVSMHPEARAFSGKPHKWCSYKYYFEMKTCIPAHIIKISLGNARLQNFILLLGI
jgi:hypothetical protein